MKWDTKLEEIAAPTKYPIGDGDHGAIKPEMYQSHGVPYIRVADIKWDGRIDRSKMVYISEEVNKVNPKSFLYPGDIIISKTGATIGKVAIIPDDFPISNTTASIGKVSLDFTKANSRFVFWCMKSRNFQEQMWSVSHKSAQPGFNVQNLKIFKIPLPPLPQQQKIANILDVADDLRQNDKALIAKYDELTQALFLDMFGDPVSNPKGWEKVELKKLCSFKKKNIKPEDIEEGENYVALDSIEKVTGNITTVYNVEKGELKSNKFWFDNSYILYGKLRPYLNKVALPNFEGVCSTDIIPIQPITTKANKLFITSILRHNSFVAFADERSSGANLPRISPSEVEKYSTINPPLSLQNQFAERVVLIEEQKAIAQKSLEKSESLFNSLLQKAFKGELA